MKLPLVLSILLISQPTLIFAQEKTNTDVEEKIEIKQTVDEDLKSFNFDYNRYKVEPTRVYQPILINYRESNSKDYYDLLYFYDPNDEFKLNEITIDISTGDNTDSLNKVKEQKYKLIEAGTSEDNTIKRYAFKGYEDYRTIAYRKYDLKSLSYNDTSIQLVNSYLFKDKILEFEYSNCLNVRLEDPHAWSWHFDEDSLGENTWEACLKWLGFKNDTLKDQLFYSFYVANWNVKEIKSIDLVYKKVLLEGFRHNEADEGSTSEFYKGTDKEFSPKYYEWNDNNTKDNYDTSNYLGSSLSEIGSKVDYTHKTITSEEKTSVGIGHDYTWKSILTKNQFKDTFKEKSDIYKFASNYFNGDNYWVINYDDFFYHYNDNNEFQFFGDPYKTNPSMRKFKQYDSTKYSDFISYLKHHNVEAKEYSNLPNNYYMKFYNFSQEYTFDIQATNMTFEDNLKTTYSLPISVAPVDEEASGGFSEYPTSTRTTRIFKLILIILALTITFIIVLKIVSPLVTMHQNRKIIKSLKGNKKK